jgi:hypothetical protein
MKIEYMEWTCLVCKKDIRILKETNKISFMPYWFTIKTEGCLTSSECPSFNTSVCSIACLALASDSIEQSIAKKDFSIPNKKDIEATICDQCGKVVKVDSLNLFCCLPDLPKGWAWKKNQSGEFHFCSSDCEQNNFLKPEEATFYEFDMGSVFTKHRIIEVINDFDFPEAIRASKLPLIALNQLQEELLKIK